MLSNETAPFPYPRGRGWDFFAAIVGLFWFVHINAVGEIFPAELMLVAVVFPLWVRWGGALREAIPRRIIMLGLVWLGGQVLTDIIRDTPSSDFLRGWASIIFFLLDFVALYILLKRCPRRLSIFIASFALGGVLQVVFDPYPAAAVEWWKFGYGLPISLLAIFLMSSYWRDRHPGIALLGGAILAGLSVYLNARSLGGMILMAFLLNYFARSGLFRNIALSGGRLAASLKLLGGMAALAFFFLFAYSIVGGMGVLPKNAQEKFDLQASSNLGLVGIIVGGRMEMLASSMAVADSPIIGHGSWAQDPKYKFALLQLLSLGYDYDPKQLEEALENQSNLIPAHSHVMQAWVWAGILGAIFWLYIVVILGRVLVNVMRFPPHNMLLVSFVLIRGFWDWAFSPFGAGFMRITWSWELIVMLIALEFAVNARQHKV